MSTFWVQAVPKKALTIRALVTCLDFLTALCPDSIPVHALLTEGA